MASPLPISLSPPPPPLRHMCWLAGGKLQGKGVPPLRTAQSATVCAAKKGRGQEMCTYIVYYSRYVVGFSPDVASFIFPNRHFFFFCSHVLLLLLRFERVPSLFPPLRVQSQGRERERAQGTRTCVVIAGREELRGRGREGGERGRKEGQVVWAIQTNIHFCLYVSSFL